MDNHLIDGLSGGRIGRGELLCPGSLLGLSLSLPGRIGFAVGPDDHAAAFHRHIVLS